jgi:hypothetical protein
MRLPLEYFARDYLARDTAVRMTWICTRTNDLYRFVQGVKDAATRVMDQGAPIAELDAAIACLESRLQHIRSHAAAVSELRESEHAALNSDP